ncbi:PAS domain S-box protein [candidate division GN15 bacterium]|nr:PAS domain S-box protein [candidate division GN15 bacterium]
MKVETPDQSGPRQPSSDFVQRLWPISVILLTAILIVAVYISIAEDRRMRGQFRMYAGQYQQMVADQVAGDVGESLHDIFRELRTVGRIGTSSATTPEKAMALQVALDQWQVKGLVEIGLLGGDGTLLMSERVTREAQAEWLGLAELLTAHQHDTALTGYIAGQAVTDPGDTTRYLLRAYRFDRPEPSTWAYAIIDIAWLARSVLRVGGADSTGYAYLMAGDSTVLFRPEGAPPPHVSQAIAGEESAQTAIACYGCGPVERWSVVVAAADPATQAIREHRTRRHAANVAMVVAAVLLISLGFWQQRRVARQLRTRIGTQSEFLSAVLQGSVDAIIFIDNDNRVRVWNRGAEMIFGWSADEMIGESFHRLVPPELDPNEELETIRDAVYRDGYIQNYQAQRITKDDRRITVNFSRTLITDNKGQPLGSTAILKDVTEKIEMDKQLYNTEKLASIGILAAGVAHEINNPLAVILGFTDLLKEKFPEDSPERADLTIIEETANNAKKIVENMLGFARVSEGQKDTVTVNDAIDAVLRITRHNIDTARIELVTDEVRSNLPAVVGDPREYQQVLFNLLNNAVAAMEADGGRLSIAAWAEEGQVHVRISDTGSGIPDRIKSKVFDPFFTTKKVGEGTGLGLSLSYGIVQKYGGELRFTSRAREDFPDQPGRTTFTVSMPVANDGHAAEDAGNGAGNTGR